jgi:hypothetical protein
MEARHVNIWFDPEGDFLEVMWGNKPGEFVETTDGRANIKLDDDDNILGFHILAVSKITKPMCVTFDIDDPDVEQCQCRKTAAQNSDA